MQTASIQHMTPEQYINDLKEAVAEVDAIREKGLTACREYGESWTPEQMARWEGSFKMVLGILFDTLQPMARSWEAGHPQYRSTEAMGTLSSNERR